MPGSLERNRVAQIDPASRELARKFLDSPTILSSMQNDLTGKGLPRTTEHPLGKKNTRTAHLNDPNAKNPVDIFVEMWNPEEICLLFKTGIEQSELIASMWERDGEFPIDHVRKAFDSQYTNHLIELRIYPGYSSTYTEYRDFFPDGQISSWHAFCPQSFALIFLNLVKPKQKVTPYMEALMNEPALSDDSPFQSQRLFGIGNLTHSSRYNRDDPRVEKKIAVADAVIAQINSDRGSEVKHQQANKGPKSRFERTANKKAKEKARKNEKKKK